MLRKKLVLLLLTVSPAIFAQDEAAPAASAPEKEYVKKTFENGLFINTQTIENPSQKAIDMQIEHRFGKIFDASDLYGIFSSANIRIGFDYGITKNLSVGIGATRGMTYDIEWKYAILRQTTTSGMPVSVSYFGDVGIRNGDNKNFLNQKNEYVAANRASFFHEILIARKFNSKFSWQLAGSYSYFNLLPDSTMNHGIMGISTIAQYRVTSMMTVQVEFDYPLNPDMVPDATDPLKKVAYQKPNLAFGFEYSTGSHQFQVFVCTSNGLAGQEVLGNNSNDFTKNPMLIGFNITRQFEF